MSAITRVALATLLGLGTANAGLSLLDDCLVAVNPALDDLDGDGDDHIDGDEVPGDLCDPDMDGDQRQTATTPRPSGYPENYAGRAQDVNTEITYGEVEPEPSMNRAEMPSTLYRDAEEPAAEPSHSGRNETRVASGCSVGIQPTTWLVGLFGLLLLAGLRRRPLVNDVE